MACAARYSCECAAHCHYECTTYLTHSNFKLIIQIKESNDVFTGIEILSRASDPAFG